MKIIICLFAVLSSLCNLSFAADQKIDKSLIFDVTDRRAVITRDIDKTLLLRITKDSSGIGWEVEVVRKPYNMNSSNLLYHSLNWHGPYPSQVYAWHVAENYFPNERDLETRGYPYELKIILVNPIIEKAGTDVKFVSGTVRITWKRK